MDQNLIDRYQQGGDIYAAIAAKYGAATADAAASAAQTGDETQINSVLSQAIYGNPLQTSTAAIFLDQITTNPLGAPLDSLNNVLKNTVGSIFSNGYIVTALVIGAAIYLGGIEALSSSLRKK